MSAPKAVGGFTCQSPAAPCEASLWLPTEAAGTGLQQVSGAAVGVDSRLQPSCKLRLGGQGGDKSPGLQLVLVQELSMGDGGGGGLVGWGGGWSGAETSKPVPRELQACRQVVCAAPSCEDQVSESRP